MNSTINSEQVNLHGLLHTKFIDQYALARPYLDSDTIDTAIECSVVLEKLLAMNFRLETLYHDDVAILQHDLGTVLIEFDYEVTFHIASFTQNGCATLKTSLHDLLPRRIPKIDTVPISFWAERRGEASRRIRELKVPEWSTIKINYAERAGNAMEEVLAMTPADLEESGRLILLYGIPGTGKTFFIRALAKAWAAWCNIHYVTDPEKFFGDSDYMLSVVMDYNDAPMKRIFDADEPKTPDWNLLILEDSSEFLVADAQLQAGQQSLSRLLNLSQGLIGQGLNIIILITTNEPVEKIHDAIKRDGRALAEIEVPELSAAEITHWCEAHFVEKVPAGPKTLGQLYSLIGGHKKVVNKKGKNVMGFK